VPSQAASPPSEISANEAQLKAPAGNRPVAAPNSTAGGSRPNILFQNQGRAIKSVEAPISPQDEKTASVVRIALILTLMAILPAILLCMTSFVRIIVVLSMIRHGLGMPETPPNQVLISLAIFLTIFSMMPTFSAVNDQALQPFLTGKLTISEAVDRGTSPAREFMLRQVRDQDIKAIYDMSGKPLPSKASEVGLMELVPAFMLNELRVSFRIGFVILLPFLLIDLVVSSILLSLGMLMVPPTTLSLPIKVLMFVLIDGWSLVLQGVLGSFR
jgi:flagellar biosynthetic protein FliP